MHMHAMYLKLWTGYHELPQDWNAMHDCASKEMYSCDMLMKCMLIP